MWRSKWLWGPVGFGAALWLAATITGCLAAQQERMIFPAADGPPPRTPGPHDPAVQQVWLTAEDGSRVEAWYQPGRPIAGAAAGGRRPGYLYCHANGDTVDSAWWIAAHTVPMGFATLAVEYRGYGRSGGEPSEKAIIADTLRFYDWLAARPEVDPQRIVVHGTSLGGGVAVAVAAERPVAALVLECTFASVVDLAAAYLQPAGVVRHPFRSDERIQRVQAPIAIFHGTWDATIPVWHGRKLARLAPHATFTELPCGHHNFHNDWENVAAFLQRAGVTE